jgi:sodium-dependent phosphate cotransporter
MEEATWGEVASACCTHDAAGWGLILVGVAAALFFLYFFLFALELLGNSAKVLGGCSAGGLLSDEANPVAGLVIGALATALVQSSSTTTSIVVTLVGAEAVSVKSGIYLIMGANIGTSVTNTIVAMGQMGSDDQLERAFSGATVHDLFNLLAVACLFPIELVTGYLYRLTGAMLPASVAKGDKWEGPLKKIVSPLASRVLKANKSVIKDVATKKVESCAYYYPVTCVDGIEDYKNCASSCDKDAGESFDNGDCGRVGLITCDKKSGCPFFFQEGATQQDDSTAGGVCLFLSLVLLLVCLMGLVNVLQRGLLGMSTRVIYKATKVPGVFAIAIGAAITVLVQSSSITTSVLTPIVGLGVIQLEQMFPLTLGANIGTTVTGLLAALVSGKVEALQVALAHLFFNLSGIVIWYPIPFMRQIPLNGARALGRWTRRSRSIPPLYVLVVFFIIPLLLLGLSELFQQGKTGYTVLGVFLSMGVAFTLARLAWFWQKQNGKEKFLACLDKRKAMSDVQKTLPEDMQSLKADVARLVELTDSAGDESGATKDEEDSVLSIDAMMRQTAAPTLESAA